MIYKTNLLTYKSITLKRQKDIFIRQILLSDTLRAPTCFSIFSCSLSSALLRACSCFFSASGSFFRFGEGDFFFPLLMSPFAFFGVATLDLGVKCGLGDAEPPSRISSSAFLIFSYIQKRQLIFLHSLKKKENVYRTPLYFLGKVITSWILHIMYRLRFFK